MRPPQVRPVTFFPYIGIIYTVVSVQFIAQKIAIGNLTGTISLKFRDSNSKTLVLKPVIGLEVPSDKAAKKIKKIIKEKEDKLNQSDAFGIMMLNQDIPMIGGTIYENRSISTLKENLESVKETYQEDDLSN